MIDFQRIDPERREEFVPFLELCSHRGSGYSFANLYMWGCQQTAVVEGQLTVFSNFNEHTLYSFPIGTGDPRPALQAVMADARERGIPCRITGMTESEKERLETLFPGQFQFHCGRDHHDYVYDINDLAELKGRRYQQKRNHVNRFMAEHPEAYVEVITEEHLQQIRAFAAEWYARRLREEPEEDIAMERVALGRALRNFGKLGLEGLMLCAEGKIVAMTLGSRLSEDTVDVHYEKADTDFHGAYPAINRAFARYIREKYPQVKYLNREDDMGDEGLRKSKLSYHPHHMVEKCWAHLKTEALDD